MGSQIPGSFHTFKMGRTWSIIIILMFVSCDGSEPHCSKFPYEEALLEKMIRMEIKVEQMEKGINGAIQEMTAEIGKLKDMEIILEETREEKSQTDAKLTRITQDMRNIQNKIRSLTESTKTSAVYFAARAERNLVFNSGDIFVFEEVMANTNQSYDPATGKFTAPVNRIYLFSTQLCCRAGDPIEYAYMLNGQLAQRARSYQSTGSACQTSIMIKQLNHGDKVWTQNTMGNNLSSSEYRKNLFSGVLVSII